jgi:hypothetical protein
MLTLETAKTIRTECLGNSSTHTQNAKNLMQYKDDLAEILCSPHHFEKAIQVCKTENNDEALKIILMAIDLYKTSEQFAKAIYICNEEGFLTIRNDLLFAQKLLNRDQPINSFNNLVEQAYKIQNEIVSKSSNNAFDLEFLLKFSQLCITNKIDANSKYSLISTKEFTDPYIGIDFLEPVKANKDFYNQHKTLIDQLEKQAKVVENALQDFFQYLAGRKTATTTKASNKIKGLFSNSPLKGLVSSALSSSVSYDKRAKKIARLLVIWENYCDNKGAAPDFEKAKASESTEFNPIVDRLAAAYLAARRKEAYDRQYAPKVQNSNQSPTLFQPPSSNNNTVAPSPAPVPPEAKEIKDFIQFVQTPDVSNPGVSDNMALLKELSDKMAEFRQSLSKMNQSKKVI